MPIPHSTAKWLAPTCFIIDLAAQTYGIFSTPNMKDINDRNLSFWTPSAPFLALIFFSLQVVQIAWLYRLIRPTSPRGSGAGTLEEMLEFVPFYCFVNLCLAVWMVFWNAEYLVVSDLFVIVYAVAILEYMYITLRPMDTRSTSSVLTHVVVKIQAGLGVLDVLHNTSIAYFKDAEPSLAVKVATAVYFGIFSASGDWIFGGCMVYDLLALAAGQSGSWRLLLVVYAVGAAAIVAAKNIARPPYNREQAQYIPTATEDV